MPMTTRALTGERADLLESLARTRHFLRHTTRDLTDEQAAQRTTASELSLGGLIKHVTLTERQWIRFIQVGPEAMAWDQSSVGDWLSAFRMVPGDTLAGLLEEYAEGRRGDRRADGRAARPRCRPAAARGPLVPARCPLVGRAGCCCT